MKILAILFFGAAVASGGLIPIAVQRPGKPRVTIVDVRPEKASAKNGEVVKIEFKLEIPRGWHIYPANDPIFGQPTVFDFGPNAEVRGRIDEPKPLLHEDQFVKYDYHEGAITMTVPVALKGTAAGPVKISGTLEYQICDVNLCIPTSTPFSLALTSLGGQDVDAIYASHGFVGLIFLGMLGGLISLLMPCTYPLVPITLTYFFKQAAGSRTHGLVLSSAYAVGMMLTFTGVGFLLTVLIGAGGARTFAANPWVNVAVGSLFLWFTGSLFGFYEIRLPFGLGEKIAAAGPRKGIGGAFILGLLFAVVTFTCTIPVLGTLFLVTAGQYRLAGLLALLAYSFTMAVPFFVMGLFPGLVRDIPRGGGWLTTVKISMAWYELALAVFYFSKADQVWQIGMLNRPVMAVLWMVVSVVAAVYLIGFPRPRPTVLRAVFAVLFLAFGAYIGYGLKSASGWREVVIPPPQIEGTTMPAGLQAAKEAGKPLFVEFTGVT